MPYCKRCWRNPCQMCFGNPSMMGCHGCFKKACGYC
jgi:hypothetical protein